MGDMKCILDTHDHSAHILAVLLLSRYDETVHDNWKRFL